MRSPRTGLVGNTLHVDSRRWVRYDSSIGAGIDSYYEYLLKVCAVQAGWQDQPVPRLRCERLHSDRQVLHAHL